MSAKKTSKKSESKPKETAGLKLDINLGGLQFNVSVGTNDKELGKAIKSMVDVTKEHFANLNAFWEDFNKATEKDEKTEKKKDEQDKPIDLSTLFGKNPFKIMTEALLGVKPHSCQDHDEQTGAKEAKGEAKKDDKPEKPKSNLTAAEFENALKKGVSAKSPKSEDLDKATWPGKEKKDEKPETWLDDQPGLLDRFKL